MKKLLLFAAIPVFIFIFLHYTNIDVWDYDFWWHLSTGRLIAEEEKIPQKDSFTFTNVEKDPVAPGREKFLLSQYWLAQVLMYYSYSALDFTGIKILRAGIITLTMLAMFAFMIKRANAALAFGFLAIAYFLFERFTGERPQLFTVLFSVLTVMILESTRDGGGRKLYTLPPLMLVWANMHGGFVLGDIIIAIYAVFANLTAVIDKRPLPRSFNVAAGASILASFINPNHIMVIKEILVLEKHFSEGIQELKSPYEMFFEKTRTIQTAYQVLLFSSILPLVKMLTDIRASQPVRWERLAVIYMLMIMSFKSARYIIFYSTAGGMLIALETNSLWQAFKPSWRIKNKIKQYVVYCVSIVLAIIFSYKVLVFDAKAAFSSSVSKAIYPSGAVKFLKENEISGMMFNDYGWGGYLIWNLYPKRQVFIDSRGLNSASMIGYGAVTSGHEEDGKKVWDTILKSYGINIILMPPVDIYGRLYPLIPRLIKSPDWSLVNSDFNSVLFVRHTEENLKLIVNSKKPSEDAFDSVISASVLATRGSGINPSPYITLGDVFVELKRFDDAKQAYGLALSKDPFNKRAQDALKDLEADK